MIVDPSTDVYIGMIVGIANKEGDLDVNPCKNKELTNTRSAHADEAIVLKHAVRDLNPKKVLDNCKNLELHYGHGGVYAKVFGLASDGVKTIYCKHGGIITNWNLDDAYDEFYNKYCKECEHKIRQDFKWDPDILSYVKSKKFKEILDKNPFIK